MRKILLAIILVSTITSCSPASTSLPTNEPFPTSIAGCFPTSVFTSEDMRARVNCHPKDYKMEIKEDTVVLFAFPDSHLDWTAPIFVIHIPSLSETELNVDGSIFVEDYKSPEGQKAIQAILNNEELMFRITQEATAIQERGGVFIFK